MRVRALINPEAASGKPLRLLPRIQDLFSRSPHVFDWHVTHSPADMRELITGAASDGIDAILLVGGDGTSHEALPAIDQVKLPFSILPCGRGNDFARNTGISLDMRNHPLMQADPAVYPVDLPTVNNKPYGSIACLGFDAVVNRLARDGRGFFSGTPGYIICVMRALGSFKPFEVEIRINGDTWSGRVMIVAVANGPYYGGGMKIAPHADITDGILDVCVIEEVSKAELLKNFPKVFRGKHTTHPKVLMRTGQTVEVTSAESREIFADGEYIGTTPARWLIGGRTIKLILPSSPSRSTSPFQQ